MLLQQKTKLPWPATIFAVAAGIIYNSWPLGYWLNPTVARHSLASGLEANGQPYNWLFVGGDIVSSVLVIVCCWLLWRRFGRGRSAALVGVAVGCIALFGISTIVDALLPEYCVPGVQQCASFTQDHWLLVHGMFSILASVCLCLGLVLVWWRRRTSVLLNALLGAYVVFGLLSLVQAVAPVAAGNWSQDYYMALCGVWLAVAPFAICLVAAD
jgi:hypothetical protein